jgi:hypothetical protein
MRNSPLTKEEVSVETLVKMLCGDEADFAQILHRERARAAEREWAEEMTANADMRRREGAWEDSGASWK